MRLILILSIIVFSYTAFAQSQDLLHKYFELEDKELASLSLRLEQAKFNLDNFQKLEQENRDKRQKYQNEILALELNKKNYNQNINNFSSWLTDQKNSIAITQLLGPKKKFYECFEEALAKDGSLMNAECEKKYKVKLSNNESNYLNKMRGQLKFNEMELEHKHKELIAKSEDLAAYTKRLDQDYKLYHSTLERLKNERKIIENKMIRMKKQQGPSFLCNDQLATIDLEEEFITKNSKRKGPFYKMPRDNQDGLGTCYANTAKNLLVSLSEGKAQASFLDMALQYQKRENLNESTLNLDGGASCATLKEIKKYGYCDQKYAYAEIGSPHPLLNDGKLVTVGMQAETIKLLQSYFHMQQDFNQKQQQFITKFMQKADRYFKQIKEQADIQFPLPIIDQTPAHHWKLREIFYIKNNASEEIYARFLAEAKQHDQIFRKRFINLIKDQKSHQQIIADYKKSFMPLLEKYNLIEDWDKIQNFYMNDFKNSYTPKNAQSLLKSLDFVRSIDESAYQASELISSCQNVLWDGVDVLDKLLPFARALESVGVSFDSLTSSTQLASDELIQLIVAPSCANSENRTPVSTNFTCSDGHDFIKTIKTQFKKNEAQDLFRLRVMTNLLDGLAMGNSHPTDNGHHINTIVGLRFNPQTKSCEVKIRESQNGRSDWHDEGKVMQRMTRLVEVSRN